MNVQPLNSKYNLQLLCKHDCTDRDQYHTDSHDNSDISIAVVDHCDGCLVPNFSTQLIK